MKVGEKAVNSYLLHKEDWEEYTHNSSLSLSFPHFSLTLTPKITEAQKTQHKGLQGFLGLRH